MLGPNRGRPFRGRRHGGVRIAHDMSDTKLIKLWNEIEIYSMLEDELSCSGMCKKSLFFFSKNITEGPPNETCLHKFKEYMEMTAEAYAATSILCGINIIILFLLHFCLYCRPNPEYEIPDSKMQGANGQVKRHKTNVKIDQEL